ncbi:unnamed protein product [Trifolium pratense]|uniref:Uncharacterized protein n=1 Tax=Trifolium pratense TaxID=57577 RepID=A0ACB0KNE7_TRIPR|nr:unnamed protein product [Trifolium pratense]
MCLFSSPRLISSSSTATFHLRRFSAKSVERVHNVWISGLIDPNKVTKDERSMLYTGQIEEMHRARWKNERSLMEFEDHSGYIHDYSSTYSIFSYCGEKFVYKREIPEDLEASVLEKRRELIEVVSRVDDKLAESFCNGRIIFGAADLQEAIRRVTIARKFIPVFMGGGAFKYKGLQLLLDGVLNYFLCPIEASNYSLDQSKNGEKYSLVALAFTLKDRIFQITFLSLSSLKMQVPYVIGVLNNMPERFPEVQEANAGEIVTLALPMNRQGRPFEGKKISKINI